MAIWVGTSYAERRELLKKWSSSLPENLPFPSALLLGIETAARLNCEVTRNVLPEETPV